MVNLLKQPASVKWPILGSTRDCCPAEEDKHSSDGAQEVTLPKFDFKPPRYRQMSISAVDACGGTPLPAFRFSFNSTDPLQEQKLIPSPHTVNSKTRTMELERRRSQIAQGRSRRESVVSLVEQRISDMEAGLSMGRQLSGRRKTRRAKQQHRCGIVMVSLVTASAVVIGGMVWSHGSLAIASQPVRIIIYIISMICLIILLLVLYANFDLILGSMSELINSLRFPDGADSRFGSYYRDSDMSFDRSYSQVSNRSRQSSRIGLRSKRGSRQSLVSGHSTAMQGRRRKKRSQVSMHD